MQKVNSADGQALELTKMTVEEKKLYEIEQKALRGEAIEKAAGFSMVMEAMRDSGKPAAGHNCIFDVAYVLESFAQPLPESWPGEPPLPAHFFNEFCAKSYRVQPDGLQNQQQCIDCEAADALVVYFKVG